MDTGERINSRWVSPPRTRRTKQNHREYSRESNCFGCICFGGHDSLWKCASISVLVFAVHIPSARPTVQRSSSLIYTQKTIEPKIIAHSGHVPGIGQAMLRSWRKSRLSNLKQVQVIANLSRSHQIWLKWYRLPVGSVVIKEYSHSRRLLAHRQNEGSGVESYHQKWVCFFFGVLSWA